MDQPDEAGDGGTARSSGQDERAEGTPPPLPPPLPYVPYAPVYAPPPPRVWPVFVSFAGLLTVGTAAAVVVFIAVAAILVGEDALRQGALEANMAELAPALLISMLATMLIIGGTAVVAAALSPVHWRDRLRVRPSRASYPGLLLLLLGATSISWMFGALVELIDLPEGGTLQMVEDLLGALSPGGLLAAALVIGLAAGVAEELFFRGYMQTRLRQRMGMWGAIFLTSVLFGVMHLDLVQGTFAMMFGVFLGYVTERTGSIRPAILCHVGSNTIAVLAMPAADVEEAPAEAKYIILLAGAVILVLSVLYVRYFLRPVRREVISHDGA